VAELADYVKHFAHLNRAPGTVWTDTTKRKAPHKPIPLLAVLDLAGIIRVEE
jgi:putative restriction endonuclease